MDKKSALQILEFANEELQGKIKNLVWCDAEQKNISVAVPENYELPEADAAGRSITKNGFPPFQNLPAEKEILFLYRPIKQMKNLKII